MSDSRVTVTDSDSDDGKVGRRTVLRGVAVGGVSISALAAACGGGDEGGEASDAEATGGAEPTDSAETGGGSGGGGTELGMTSEVPVGGGVIYSDQEVVVTQPTKGEFVGFSAICTHQGCPVAEVSGGSINCECHGSMFSIEDGSVVEGPAASPLDSADVTVQGQRILLA